MAIPAGRKGVKSSQVDWQGNVIGGGGESTLAPRVTKLEGQVGTFEFLVEDGVAGYKKTGADTFNPFSKSSTSLDLGSSDSNYVSFTIFTLEEAEPISRHITFYSDSDRTNIIGECDTVTGVNLINVPNTLYFTISNGTWRYLDGGKITTRGSNYIILDTSYTHHYAVYCNF